MSHYHAVIWIDHKEARVFHFNPEEVEKLVLHPDHPSKHVQHNSNEEHKFFHAAVEAIADAGAVLVVGPAHTKTDFVKYLEQHNPRLKSKIAAVENADHPTDGQIVAHARKYFKAEDRITPQTR
jgi:stalled ribosome rescue protein Dom34